MANEHIEILKFLIQNNSQSFSIRKLSKARSIDYKSAYQAVKKLEEQGVISVNRTGNNSLCRFNFRFNPSVFLAEYERRQAVLANKNILLICEELRKIPVSFIALLFGSYAKLKNTKDSDIDILAISENPSEIRQKLSLIALDIHLTVISPAEFWLMLKSREDSVVSEAIKCNLILIGIEGYYRYLENANIGANQAG
jgi:predicted nucleotidyltransferase